MTHSFLKPTFSERKKGICARQTPQRNLRSKKKTKVLCIVEILSGSEHNLLGCSAMKGYFVLAKQLYPTDFLHKYKIHVY